MNHDRGAAGRPAVKSELPGRGGLKRIWAAAGHSMRGLSHGVTHEAAVKQELAIVLVALPVSFLLARSALEWALLVGVLVLMLSAEFLNTAIERLCDHVTPDRHEAIRETKDLASAGVFLVQFVCALVWGAVALDRLGVFG